MLGMMLGSAAALVAVTAPAPAHAFGTGFPGYGERLRLPLQACFYVTTHRCFVLAWGAVGGVHCAWESKERGHFVIWVCMGETYPGPTAT